MADVTTANRLRKLLGEEIPLGGTAADTLFSDLDIQDLLTRHGGTVERSLAEAWEMKAASLSSLVDVTEGDQSRKLSQARQAALQMAEYFRKVNPSDDNDGTRTRIRTLNRGGFQG